VVVVVVVVVVGSQVKSRDEKRDQIKRACAWVADPKKAWVFHSPGHLQLPPHPLI
jgi:hypothetical protein